MPFLDHLEELRWRIIYSLIGLIIGVAIGLFCAFKYDILGLLQQPMLPYLNGRKLTILHPMDPFSIRIKLGFMIGLVVSAPVIVYQVWAFMSPALHKPEKRVMLPTLFAAVILFLVGVSLAWFIVLPVSLKWLYPLSSAFDPSYTATNYFGFAANLALAFGAAFEMPLLIVALSALNIVSAKMLTKSRKFAVLFIWVGSAVVSPGDAITVTIAMAIPLYLLYELSIVVAFLIERKRAARQAREQVAAAA